MPEAFDRDLPLGALIKESFAGEWGLETPQLGFVRSRVVRSTEIDDDGSVALTTAVERFIPSEKVAAKGLRDGDIVIESAGGSPARPVGRPAILRVDDYSSPIMSSNFVRTLRFDTEKITQNFAIHALRRLYAQPRFGVTQQKTTGIINLNFGEFQKLRIWVPGTVDLQALIADILDAVDDAVLEADALFEKLRTVRVGMIDDLLTRGVADDGSPRVSSALVKTMVGPRPGTWKVANLGRFVVGAEYGTNLSLGDSSAGIPVLRMNNIQDGEFDLSDLKYAPAHAVERFRVQRDDVLFNRTNSWEHVGKAAIWRHDEPGPAFASYLVRLHCGDELLPEFLHLWLNWAPVQRAIRQFATPGVQQVNINPTNLRRALIAVPDTLDEQRAIIERVNGVSSATEDHRRERAKLASLREGLRDDLLSGRKPVAAIREAAE
jgi:type I restriction enzyme S subunit